MRLIDLATAVDSFFFDYRVDAIIPALMRIGISLVILVSFFTRLSDARVFLSPEGAFGDEQYSALKKANPQLDFIFWLPAHLRPPNVLLLLLFLSGLSAAFGFFTHCALALLFVLTSSIQSRMFLAVFSGGDSVVRMLLLCLLLTDSGARLSIDAFVNSSDVAYVSGWAIRLLQVYICVIYFWSAIHKCESDYWIRGEAVKNALRSGIWSRGLSSGWLERRFISKTLAFSTLAFEFFAPITIWIEDLRAITLTTAILFHTGITVFLRIGYFGPAMIVGLISFI